MYIAKLPEFLLPDGRSATLYSKTEPNTIMLELSRVRLKYLEFYQKALSKPSTQEMAMDFLDMAKVGTPSNLHFLLDWLTSADGVELGFKCYDVPVCYWQDCVYGLFLASERYADRSVFRDSMLHPLRTTLVNFSAFYLRSEQVVRTPEEEPSKECVDVSGLEFEV